MELLRRADSYTWNKLPTIIQSSIERDSWWKILLTYSTLLVLVIYRFVITRRSIFFHSYPVARAQEFSSQTQIKELIIHLVFFFLPMILAVSFNHVRQADERVVE